MIKKKKYSIVILFLVFVLVLASIAVWYLLNNEANRDDPTYKNAKFVKAISLKKI